MKVFAAEHHPDWPTSRAPEPADRERRQ